MPVGLPGAVAVVLTGNAADGPVVRGRRPLTGEHFRRAVPEDVIGAPPSRGRCPRCRSCVRSARPWYAPCRTGCPRPAVAHRCQHAGHGEPIAQREAIAAGVAAQVLQQRAGGAAVAAISHGHEERGHGADHRDGQRRPTGHPKDLGVERLDVDQAKGPVCRATSRLQTSRPAGISNRTAHSATCGLTRSRATARVAAGAPCGQRCAQ